MSISTHSTLYVTHLDSFAWQQTRERKLAQVGHRCERCKDFGPLQVHHKHYNTLGWERLP